MIAFGLIRRYFLEIINEYVLTVYWHLILLYYCANLLYFYEHLYDAM
jgi:hypothetical protein